MRSLVVRHNLVTQEGYTPYCGNMGPDCFGPRTFYNGAQFECPECKWQSEFEPEFIIKYLNAQRRMNQLRINPQIESLLAEVGRLRQSLQEIHDIAEKADEQS